ncbi:hypothetical protein MIR68_008409 [Amoeboaphelidium protococcarum]|nr:hypothetical protein MIR68_008409 [Amoeboaphelidium protococcarum]
MNRQFFIDYSGSTGGCAEYWNYVRSVVGNDKQSSYFFWDTQCSAATRQEVSERCDRKHGNGGTSPHCIVSDISSDSQVLIITDGQVPASEVVRCDEALAGRKFQYVEVHFVGGEQQMNLSVSAPFTRNVQKFRLVLNGKVLDEGSTSASIEFDEYFGHPDKFLLDFDDIYKRVSRKFLGQYDEPMRNKLLNLQSDLLKCASQMQSDSSGKGWDELRSLLNSKQYEQSIAKLRAKIAAADMSMAQKLGQSFEMLLQCCSPQANFSFNNLQPGRLSRAQISQRVEAEDLVETENKTGFECPIMYDQESAPVLGIKAGDGILKDLSKDYLDAIFNCPLLILNDDSLVNKLKERFDMVLSLEAFKGISAFNHQTKSPMTGAQLSCVLPTGDHPSHLSATVYCLANLFLGSKLVGLPVLYLYVVYRVLGQVRYIAENKEFMDAMRSCVMDRMLKANTYITLTGQVVEPMIKAPVDIAVWYCVVSARLHTKKDCDGSDSDDARNRLRSFGAASQYLVDIVDNLFQYPFEKEWTLKRLALYRAFAWMMKQEKERNTQWRDVIRAQHQNHIILSDGSIIFLDGKAPSDKPKLPFENLSVQEVYGLSLIVDAGKTVNTVMIPDNIRRELPAAVKNYGYPEGLTQEQITYSPKVCPTTLRPFLVDQVSHKPWKLNAESVYGPLDKQLCVNSYFTRYVWAFKQYPTRDCLIKFMAQKQSTRLDAKDTLPQYVVQFVDAIFKSYHAVLGDNFQNIPADQFIKRTIDSVSIVKREQIEKTSSTV